MGKYIYNYVILIGSRYFVLESVSGVATPLVLPKHIC
jgi:hypothetical protein